MPEGGLPDLRAGIGGAASSPVAPLPVIDGGFGVILADPPWHFRSHDGRAHGVPSTGKAKWAHYQTVETGEMAQWPVADLAAKDCALFMWVVDSHLDQALDLGRAWGFTFKTCAFVWVKAYYSFRPLPTMGYWTRKQSEQCWLFTKGKPKRLNKDVEQLIFEPRGRHSAKPVKQYRLIESLVGGPYVELFARTTQPGWRSWGNQVGVRDGALFTEVD